MFTYRCPGCGKHHSVDKPFEQAFEAKCLRCGVQIAVTAELVHQTGAARSVVQSAPSRQEAIVQAPVGSTNTETLALLAAEENEEETGAESSEEEHKKGKRSAAAQRVSAKKKPVRAEKKRRPESIEEEDDVEAVEEEMERTPPKLPFSPARPSADNIGTRRPRRQFVIAAAVVVLVVGGACAYLFLGGKKPTSKPVASKSPTTKQPTKPTPKPPAKKKPEEPPPPKPLTTRDLAISAPRLSHELTVQGDLANAKYAGKILDVSGLFGKIEKKDGVMPPPRPHLVFATQGTPISCDLQSSLTQSNTWYGLKPNQPITVRGKYDKNGFLRECTLLEFSSTADNNYKDKPLQVSGHVAEVIPATNLLPFPRIRLEGETDSLLEIHCLFRRTDAGEVQKIQLGSAVVVEGLCAGREKTEGNSHIRLDNCRLVYDSAPTEKMPRLDAARLLREYEEEIRPLFLPPPGQEQQIEGLWTVRQLSKEPLKDEKKFDTKYRYRILHVVGKPQSARDGTLMLESGDTDLGFRVECRFSKSDFQAVSGGKLPEYRVRGLCTAMSDPRTIRLDNCRIDAPLRKGPILTADYLPHRPGRSFAIDVAALGVKIERREGILARRERHVQGDNGISDILVTHQGELVGKSLFDEGIQDKWVQNKKARIKTPSSAGRYMRRLHAGFIEIGTPYLDANGKINYTWMPVLKLGAEAGTKWKWEPPTGTHEFVLEKFDEFRGQPCAYVRELVTLASNVLYPIEILHVYANGYGEVERREWRHLDQFGRKVLTSESRWVDNVLPPLDSQGKPVLTTPSDEKKKPSPK
jgi:hypothetical protein